MTVSFRVRGAAGLIVLWGVGCVLFGVHLFHFVLLEENLRAFMYGIGFPMSLSVSLLISSTWFWHEMDAEMYFHRIAGWSIVGGLVLAVAAVFTILYQRAEGVVMSHRIFVVANAATGGAAVGSIIGFYDYRRLLAQTRETRTDERATRLNQQLSVISRVLRHDLRNRATTIRTRADLLATECDDPDSHTDAICRQVTELIELSERLSEIDTVLRENDSDRQVVDLSVLVREALERVRESDPEVSIQASLPDSQPVYAQPGIDTAIQNVVENAIEHNDASTPRIEVAHAYRDLDGSTYFEVRVADNGPGIPDNEVRVLERGYETPLEHSSGLGLWFIHWVVTDSGGDVWFEENDPTGSVVGIRLQCADSIDQ